MIITLERSELTVLTLNMNVLRKTIKKGFKTNYGAFEGKKKLKSFDELKERFENEFQEEKDHYEIDLSDDEFTMLYSFMNWYVSELKRSFNGQETNDEQIIILYAIDDKIKQLITTEEEVS